MRKMKACLFIAIFASVTCYAFAQHVTPVIRYTLTVDATDTTGYSIAIHIQHAPVSFRLAMATHPEYDDRFWRYIQHFAVETGTGKGSFIKQDSNVWAVNTPGGDVDIKYRLQLPTDYPYHPCHRPFLSKQGGLVGDIHSFMYMVGYEELFAEVKFILPAGWQIATGLAATGKPEIYKAANVATLLDCPVFIGNLQAWSFTVNKTPHRVVYLPLPGAKKFDTVLLVNNIKKIVEQATKLFGGFPYKSYTFLLRDGTYGALEHANSVTIGAPAEMLADNMQQIYGELAHEFLHTWNLVNIRPAEYSDVNCGPQQQSAALWFSEGFTMLYADLLLRRAGLPAEDTSRIAHLEALTGRYYTDTGNTFITPAKVSLASNEQPGMLGDYNTSTHLQGELIGAMLDIIIRNATNNKQSLDGVMRTMYKRFGGKKGFEAKDVEQAAKEVCGCDVHGFFKRYVYDGSAVDFNAYLQLMGLQLQRFYHAAKNDKVQPLPDLRIYAWRRRGDTAIAIGLLTPNSCWGRAGLHTGDVIVSINSHPIKTERDFFATVRNIHIGDTLICKIKQASGIKKITVIISGYNTVVTRITALQNVSAKQRLLLGAWERSE